MNPQPAVHMYGAALRAAAAGERRVWTVRYDDGTRRALEVPRWSGAVEPGDGRLLDHCTGVTLDVGCGPGRIAAELAARGVPALGVDVAPEAVRQCLRRGGMALRRDVFSRLPGEGRWRHVILADGNIGIGGNPAVLLRRTAGLLARSGTLLCEADRPGTALARTRVRLEDGHRHSEWFPWAHVGVDVLADLARARGLRVVDEWTEAGRWFLAFENG